MTTELKPQDVRDAIVEALHEISAGKLPASCVTFGLAEGTEAEAYNSKKAYVYARLEGKAMPDLLEVAQKICAERNAPALQELIDRAGCRAPQGELRNLIFASTCKPQIRLRDATRNVIEITRGADQCLVYDRPLGVNGLTWAQLVQWWVQKNGKEDWSTDDARALWWRLWESLEGNGAEEFMLRTYSARYGEPSDVPAMLPQVWLHYDPRRAPKKLDQGYLDDRQRMDFLLLLPGGRHVVLEIDGKGHYSDRYGKAAPDRYANMVRQDRRLRLAGYEIYRFGGAEFVDRDAAEVMLKDFFDDLLKPTALPSL